MVGSLAVRSTANTGLCRKFVSDSFLIFIISLVEPKVLTYILCSCLLVRTSALQCQIS